MTILGIGFHKLLLFADTPGILAHAPEEWPGNVGIEPSRKGFTLLVFGHPLCPCSRAALDELARIMAHAPGNVEARVYFYVPPNEAESWAHSHLWDSANRIPGVRSLVDRNSQLARRFGARTSGQVLLYSAQGRLLFNGGITVRRGHAGDNTGEDAVRALILGQNTSLRTAPVLGCALYDPGATDGPGERLAWTN